MRPVTRIWIVLSVFLITESSAQPITNRNYRRHVGGASPPPNDWEVGLREAVHQTFLKEHFISGNDPGLRDRLATAPFYGKQNEATPFGDIATIARGQVYASPHGFQFVQDNGSERARCRPQSCGEQRLLALWTVKRIRHRDPNYGHRFELAYAVSPVRELSQALRHGKFDYNVPGHVFVVKSDPRFLQGNANADGRDRDKWYKHHYPTTVAYPGSVFVGYLPPNTSPATAFQIPSTTDPKEIALYQTLLESLASKTTQRQKGPTTHTFTITKADTVPITIPTRATTEETTYLQLATGHLVPITEVSPVTHQTLPVYTPIKQPITTNYRPQQTTFIPAKVPTRPQPTTVTYFTPVSEQITPSTQGEKKTTVTYFAPVSEHLMPNKPHFTQAQPTRNPTYATEAPTLQFTHAQPTRKPTYATNNIPTLDFTHAQPTRKPMYSTKVPTYSYESEEGSFELFPQSETTTTKQTSKVTLIEHPTEPWRPVTQKPLKPRPDSINDQLPKPNKATDTTVPYVPSTTSSAATTKETTAKTTTFHSTKVPQYSSTVTDGTTQTIPPTTRKQPTTVVEFSFPSSTIIPDIATPTTSESTRKPYFTTSKTATPTTTIQYFYTTKEEEEEEENTRTIPTTIFTHNPTTILTTYPLVTYTRQPTTYGTIPSTTRLRPITTNNDFLVDTSGTNNNNLYHHKAGDYNEDDIFGKQTVRSTTSAPSTLSKETTQSDLDAALFGGRKPKQQPKIIYSNFYEVSSEVAPSTNHYATEPVTKQSYSTSISFEVNKRNQSKTEVTVTTPKVTVDLAEADTVKSNENTKRELDRAALQLISHAKGIEYLQNKTDDAKQTKYRRKGGYVSKTKGGHRRRSKQ